MPSSHKFFHYDDGLSILCFEEATKVSDTIFTIEEEPSAKGIIDIESQSQLSGIWKEYNGPPSDRPLSAIFVAENCLLIYLWLGEREQVSHAIAQLKESISQLEQEGFSIENSEKSQIDSLHTYNELKDAGQMALGKIAECEGTTIREQYAKFGLDLDE
ncbi:hypothetical protein DI09_3p610 [Mitosporidium daphniae]|uniref:DNA repair protein SWI5 homolog n=1 Tax=Mitosporidium daphniae TaxID=1485682 RepID=A0A098VR54_9MICR|nr:uncharacterized protein DI09_3p610 [Mitosporidium daphniae]KGG51299.1 hypothetical protein DI09_3p610 [Mitosporidium daphniae]|eukprot:XP_013237726.1 uncharacterized protein DI09_3p610 [Mitosporidium daphniae]